MPQRRDYIDELKGLGILLVVLGHFIEQYRMGYSFVSASFFCIYAFHMALFCICSGLVARFNPRKLVTQQLWLYLVGQTLMLAFRAAVLRENFAETGGLLAAWLLPWRHIWYLYALIFWHLTLPVLCRLRDRLGLAGSCLGMALAVGLALAAGLVDWPFTLVRVFAFYPFYACGVLLRPQLDRLAAFAAEHRPVRLVAAAGLVLVQLLHFATPLMPYNFYCRNWDFGYGHYNGFGARLVGVFFAWGWLRHDRLRAFDWAGLAALAIFTYKVPGSRGAFGGMAVLFALFFVQRFLPRLFDNKIFYALALALPVALAAFSLYAGYVYNPEWPYERMALLLLSIALSGRFEIWHNVFWSAPLSLLGGLPTDGDEHHAIDNTFLAVPMNKGVLGAILVAAVFLLLLWRLAKKHRSTEVICLMALTLYLFMENKPFLLSANPFLLMLPVVFFNAETGKAQSES